ncbi:MULTISPECIES: isoaspartyl peptidase/L-asparaginase [unclassified Microcoleus]|uniref:isoaspartyl peptidase/L-asparaginase n=1 Tax=unclassified Microcoleus TaxID=2642155 RepID=UPI002FD72E30
MVRGGAKTISEEKVAANNAGCNAAEAGWAVLASGVTAAEAVEAAIRVLETDQTFNAGCGSVLNSKGEVELDAAIVEGRSLAWGAIANVQGVRHPISVARKIMDKKPMFIELISGRENS